MANGSEHFCASIIAPPLWAPEAFSRKRVLLLPIAIRSQLAIWALMTMFRSSYSRFSRSEFFAKRLYDIASRWKKMSAFFGASHFLEHFASQFQPSRTTSSYKGNKARAKQWTLVLAGPKSLLKRCMRTSIITLPPESRLTDQRTMAVFLYAIVVFVAIATTTAAAEIVVFCFVWIWLLAAKGAEWTGWSKGTA